MFCETCSEPVEARDVVRKHNRALRRIVSKLRRGAQRGGEAADKLFLALCDTDPAAELAMRELWEKGGLQSDCSPGDYDTIIDVCVRTLRAYRGTAFQPIHQPTHQPDSSHSIAHVVSPCRVPSEIGAFGWSCTRENGHGGPCAMIYDH